MSQQPSSVRRHTHAGVNIVSCQAYVHYVGWPIGYLIIGDKYYKGQLISSFCYSCEKTFIKEIFGSCPSNILNFFSNHLEVAESSLYFPFYSVSKLFYIGRVQPSFLQDTAILRVVGFLRTIDLTDQNSILLPSSIWKLSEVLYIWISL
jgi:hypothetical protein